MPVPLLLLLLLLLVVVVEGVCEGTQIGRLCGLMLRLGTPPNVVLRGVATDEEYEDGKRPYALNALGRVGSAAVDDVIVGGGVPLLVLLVVVVVVVMPMPPGRVDLM